MIPHGWSHTYILQMSTAEDFCTWPEVLPITQFAAINTTE